MTKPPLSIEEKLSSLENIDQLQGRAMSKMKEKQVELVGKLRAH